MRLRRLGPAVSIVILGAACTGQNAGLPGSTATTEIPSSTTQAGAPSTAVTPTGAVGGGDGAAFIGETIPDGTQIGAGRVFHKTWTLLNIGETTWDPASGYVFQFVDGEVLGSGGSIQLDGPVAPGEQAVLAVSLTAPSGRGTFRGTWQMHASDVAFGPQVWVEIEVVDDTGGSDAAFVAETVPDGTVIEAGEAFVKTWTLINSGATSWSPERGYALAWSRGDALGAAGLVPLPSPVAPGEQIDLSVALTAPDRAGVYRGYWQMYDTAGPFGVEVWVEISVPDNPAAGGETTPGVSSEDQALPQDDWEEASGWPAGPLFFTPGSQGAEWGELSICPKADWPPRIPGTPALSLSQIVDRAIGIWNAGAQRINADLWLENTCDGTWPTVDIEFAGCEELACNWRDGALIPGNCRVPDGGALGSAGLETECLGQFRSPTTGGGSDQSGSILLLADPGRYSAVADPNSDQLVSVLAHEIGHAVGLGHSEDTGSLMWPVNRGHLALGPDDLDGLAELYPALAGTTMSQRSIYPDRFDQKAGDLGRTFTWPYPNGVNQPFVICGTDTYNPPRDERDMGWACEFQFSPATRAVSVTSRTTGTPRWVYDPAAASHLGGTAAVFDSALIYADFFGFTIHNGSPIQGRFTTQFWAPEPPDGVFFTQILNYDPAGTGDFGYQSIYTPLGNSWWRVDITTSGGNYSSRLDGQVIVLRNPHPGDNTNFTATATWGRVGSRWEGVDWDFDHVADAADLELAFTEGYDDVLKFVVLESYHRKSGSDLLSVWATPDLETASCIPFTVDDGASTPTLCVRAHIRRSNGQDGDFADLKLVVVQIGPP